MEQHRQSGTVYFWGRIIADFSVGVWTLGLLTRLGERELCAGEVIPEQTKGRN
jgi:hypothetical protein